MELRRATSWLSAKGYFGLLLFIDEVVLLLLMQCFSEGSLLGCDCSLAAA